MKDMTCWAWGMGHGGEGTETDKDNFFNKTNKSTNFPILFWLKMNLYMFRAFLSRSCSQADFKPYDIYQCQVYSYRTPDDGHRNFPKHVEVHF